MLKNGVATAIIGAPNAGKSSLLNALVGFDRAIVTDIAGTTRDTVEEKATVGGVLLRLIDTAGLHETDDLVEQLGVERSKKAVEDADLILALLDGSTGLPASEARAGEMLAPLELAALDSVRAAKDALQSGMTPDVVLTEVEQAENALGELTGHTAREDMVARIFERFCVGK